jgi:RND family efflux transporter MFP subunit
MNTRTQHLVLATVLCAFAVGGCSHNSSEDTGDPGTASAKAEVTLTRVIRADISRTLSLTGTAAALPNDDVRVSALVPGRVASLTVAEGDSVKAGQVLATLDDSSLKAQLQQAQAAVQQAKASLDNAQLARTRNDDLFQRGIVARKDVEDARTQESVAAGTMRQSEAALELAHLQVGRSVIVAPINGMVAKRFVSVGEQVDGTAAQPIVEIANLHEVEFLGNAPAAYLGKMHPGETVEVTSETVPGRKFAGRVVAISPAVDPATGVGLVRIRVPNPDGALRMGIFLNADVAIETHSNVLTVPADAIYRNQAGQTRIFKVSQDTATAVPVQLGVESKGRAEILPSDSGGVKEDDNIIFTGGYGLGDTAQIRTTAQTMPPPPQ